jgi:hypothetical protein
LSMARKQPRDGSDVEEDQRRVVHDARPASTNDCAISSDCVM